jgi:hypothetical protein
MYSAVQCNQEPEDIEQALKCADSDKRTQVINEELDALKRNKTRELVNLPPEEKAAGNKWVFKIKHDSEGKITKYKARLVVKGFTQTYGLWVYTETFSPVVRYSTLMVPLHIAESFMGECSRPHIAITALPRQSIARRRRWKTYNVLPRRTSLLVRVIIF